MPLTLRWRDTTTLPVEAESLRPDTLVGLSSAEVAGLTLAVGNTTADLGSLFEVEGDARDGELVVEGDLQRVARIGQGMTSGRLTVRGPVGSHLGAGMLGGTIEVFGPAGHWVGAEMRGGRIHIRGSAGDYLGSAYPGSRAGMREGVILVEGAIGNEAGQAMRRGLIALSGGAGHGLGRGMIAGSIFAFGPVGTALGLGMKRGSLVLFGDPPALSILPSFARSGRMRPVFVTIYLRQLRDWGFPVPDSAFVGAFDRYNGDLAESGQGEILLWNPRELHRSRLHGDINMNVNVSI